MHSTFNTDNNHYSQIRLSTLDSRISYNLSPERIYRFPFKIEMRRSEASARHTEVLRQLNFPSNLSRKCAVTEHPSGTSIFIRFPTNALMQDRYRYLSWEVGYYAGTRTDFVEALRHGEILQALDYSASGNRLLDESRQKRWFGPEKGVYLFTTYYNAWRRSSYNLGGYTRAVMVVKLRSDAFSPVGEGKYTSRRACHVLYGLLVSFGNFQEFSSLNWTEEIPVSISPPLCRYALTCYEFVKYLGWPQTHFEPAGFHCYCRDCHPSYLPSHRQVANETYIVPKGWCCFGLHVHSLLAEYNRIWDSWANAYHGTTPMNALSIVAHGQLLINGDETMQGVPVQTRASEDRSQDRYFLTPHVCYASHPWYARIVRFRVVDGKPLFGQVVLMMKVRPGTCSKQKETEGGAKRIFDDYSVIPEDQIEWHSKCRGSVVPYGALFRVFGEQELRDITRLAWDRTR